MPKPPSLQLPEKATNLQAERVGGEVKLTWTTPSTSTDGDAIHGVMTAVLCRAHAGATAGGCNVFRQLAVTPGAAEAEDTLPAPLRVGTNSVLEYRVELRNDRGRSAGASEPAFAAAGRAPEMPDGVAAVSRREGVLITWQPELGGAPGAVTTLSRTEAVARKAATPPATKAAPSTRATPSLGGSGPANGVVTLVADAGTAANGMVDWSAADGQTYTYVAARTIKVQVGGKALELRSLPSAPATITYRDLFPPGVPVGLAAIPGGGFGAAPSVDLSWETNGEGDLLGYRVYRSVDGGPATLLTKKPVSGAAYHDLQVTAGHTYGYRVSAVDVHGNESGQGTEVRETLR